MPDVFTQLVLEHPSLQYLAQRQVSARFSDTRSLRPGTFVPMDIPHATLNELLWGWHDKYTSVTLIQSLDPHGPGRHRAA